MDEDLRFCGVFWRLAEEEDVAIWTQAVDEAGSADGHGSDSRPPFGLVQRAGSGLDFEVP